MAVQLSSLKLLLERCRWAQNLESGKFLNTQLTIFIGNFRFILACPRASLDKLRPRKADSGLTDGKCRLARPI